MKLLLIFDAVYHTTGIEDSEIFELTLKLHLFFQILYKQNVKTQSNRDKE